MGTLEQINFALDQLSENRHWTLNLVSGNPMDVFIDDCDENRLLCLRYDPTFAGSSQNRGNENQTCTKGKYDNTSDQ